MPWQGMGRRPVLQPSRRRARVAKVVSSGYHILRVLDILRGVSSKNATRPQGFIGLLKIQR